jgi:hypothetical protein
VTCRFVVECERRRRERRGEHAGVKEEEKEKMEKLKKRRRRRKKKKNPPPQNSNNAPGRTRRAISGARRTILSAGVACPRSCEREREKEEEVEFLKNRAFFFENDKKVAPRKARSIAYFFFSRCSVSCSSPHAPGALVGAKAGDEGL